MQPRQCSKRGSWQTLCPRSYRNVQCESAEGFRSCDLDAQMFPTHAQVLERTDLQGSYVFWNQHRQ
jgi:hypothetical protein